MKYLYLPGFSSKNQNELNSFVEYFGNHNIDLQTHTWRHWENPDIEWNLEVERQRVLETIDKSFEYTLIAKSYGSFVGVGLNNIIKFKKMFLMGIPFEDLNEEERKVYTNFYDSKVFVFHRKNDFHGSIEKVQNLISPESAIYHVLEGDSHEYDIPELVFSSLQY